MVHTIIDSHTHLLPERLAHTIRAFLIDHGQIDLANDLANQPVKISTGCTVHPDDPEVLDAVMGGTAASLVPS